MHKNAHSLRIMNRKSRVSLGQELRDSRIDACYHLKDGRAFPIFSRHGIEGRVVHCNICDVIIVASTEEVVSHMISSSHRNRLADSHRASAALLDYVQRYGISQDNNSVNYTDAPLGCDQDLLKSKMEAKISSTLNSRRHVGLIGLEYVVEVNAGFGDTTESFYICFLCDRRCNIPSTIVDHMVSPEHRMKYLGKFFPRAYSLFHSADTNLDRWPDEVLRYLQAVTCRIESVKGRLEVSAFHRSQWDMRSGQIKKLIENGNHFRETPDLVYDDIPSPLNSASVPSSTSSLPGDVVRTGQEEDWSPRKRQSRSPLPVKNQNSMNEIKVEETRTVVKRELDRFRNTQKDGTPEGSEKASPGGSGVKANDVDERRDACLSKLSQLRQDAARDERVSVFYKMAEGSKQEEHGTNEQKPAMAKRQSSWTDEDDDIQVEKEIFKSRKPSLSTTNRKRRLDSPSPPRSSSPHKRSRSRSETRSDSLSRSPSNSGHGSHDGYRRPSHERDDHQRPPSRGNGVQPWRSGGHQRGHFQRRGGGRDYQNRHAGGSSLPDRNQDRDFTPADEKRRLWNKLERELTVLEETLHRKRQFYEKRPEDHPLYAEEWKIFWQRRFLELKDEGKDPTGYDFKPEWILFWHRRMKELDQDEILTKKTELKRKYGLDGDPPSIRERKDDKPIKKNQRSQARSNKSGEFKKRPSMDREARIDSLDRKDIAKNPSPPPQPVTLPAEVEAIASPEIFTLDEDSSASSRKSTEPRRSDTQCETGNNTPVTSKRTVVKQDFLGVLRMLAALEDCLGSLGPSVTKLLSQALSAERARPGSSTQLQYESASIDLLDTSKEKLKGLLLTGILEGVKAGAAQSVIENIEDLIKTTVQSARPATPADGPTSSAVVDSVEMKRAHQLASLLLKQGKANISDRELQEYLASTVADLKPAQPVSAASRAVSSVDPVPERPAPVVPPPVPTVVPPAATPSVTIDTQALIANLQAAGLLSLPKPTESTTPSTPLSATPPVTAELPRQAEKASLPPDPSAQFSPEELKMLICNFRSLTASQQRDLINHLRILEERHPKPGPGPPSRPPTASRPSAARPSSPFSMKGRQFENVVNPSAPDPIPCRYPALFKLTGLSSADLEGFGLPLNEIDPAAVPSVNPLPSAANRPPWPNSSATSKNPAIRSEVPAADSKTSAPVLPSNPHPTSSSGPPSQGPARLHSILKKPAQQQPTPVPQQRQEVNPWPVEGGPKPVQSAQMPNPSPTFPNYPPRQGSSAAWNDPRHRQEAARKPFVSQPVAASWESSQYPPQAQQHPVEAERRDRPNPAAHQHPAQQPPYRVEQMTTSRDQDWRDQSVGPYHQNAAGYPNSNRFPLDPRLNRPQGYPDPRSGRYDSYRPPPRPPPMECRGPVTIPTSPVQRPPRQPTQFVQQQRFGSPSRFPGSYRGGYGPYQ